MSKLHRLTASSPMVHKALAAVLSALPFVAANADSPPATGPADGASSGLESIVVVGTNRRDQEALDSLSPISVISGETLRSSGAATLSEAIVRSDPAANFPQNTTGPQAASNGLSIALQGLAPDQTLILVNGRRLVPQSTITAGSPPMFGYMGQPQDINIIPLAAVDHIEILKDGASAQYGADAVAGVVNIVLKSRALGGEVAGNIGVYEDSHSPHGEPDPSANLSGWKGFELPGHGLLTVSAEYNSLYQPEQGAPSPNPIYGPAGSSTAQGNQPAYDTLRHLMGYAGPVKDGKILASAQANLADDLVYYGSASFAHFRKIGLSLTVDDYQSSATIGYFPQGRDDYSIVTGNAATLQQGVRYSAGIYGDFDFNLNAGVNHQGTFNALAYNAAIADYNLANPNSPYATPIGLNTGATETALTELNAGWNREFDVGQYKPLTASAGISARLDRYEQIAGEWASWFVPDGAVVGPGHYIWSAASQKYIPVNPSTPATGPGGTSPAQAGIWGRRVDSIFGDVEGQATETFSYGLASRLERYSDFGSTVSGKLSGRYAIEPSFALRSTLSNGFKAPSIAQQNYQTNGGSVAQGTLLVPSESLTTSNPLAVLLGARPLKPEKSFNFSFGAVWEPSKNSSISADVFRIDVDNVINFSEPIQDTGNGALNAFLVAHGYQSGTIARFYVNGMDTTTNGVDIVAKHRFEQPGVGTWDLSAAYEETDTTASNLLVTPAALAGTGVKLISQVDMLGVTRATPNEKIFLGEKLKHGAWTFDLLEKYYGSYIEVLSSTKPVPQTFNGQPIVDLNIDYAINKHFTWSLGAKNLFATFPDFENPSTRRVGQTLYPNLAPEGFAGRYVYTGVDFSFD